MQRRRKKTAKSGTHRHKHHGPPASSNSRLLDKSLPSLPPSANLSAAFSPDNESLASDGYSDTPTELPRISKRPVNSRSSSQAGTPTEPVRASHKRPPHSRSSSSRSSHRDKSPPGPEEDRRGIAPIRLPTPAFEANSTGQKISRCRRQRTRRTGIRPCLNPRTHP